MLGGRGGSKNQFGTRDWENVPRGAQLRVSLPILSSPQLVTLRGSILEDATPTATKHGTVRGLPLKDALEYVIPELNIHCLRLALSTPKVTEQLLKLDEQGVSGGGDAGGGPAGGWGTLG